MKIHIALTLIFVACAAYFVVRGNSAGWTTSTILWLCLSVCGIASRLVAMYRDKRQRPSPKPSVDDLLKVEQSKGQKS
jgi:hypothetical protein